MLAMNQAPIRQFIKAISEQTDLEKAYLQMFNGMLPEWESGYAPSRFNGDLKLINSEKLFKYVIEPSKKLADRLIELYPTMQAQIDTAMIHTYQYLNLNGFYDLSDYANKVAEYTKDPWHLFTGWGDWLNTTKQSPLNQSKEYKGQPVGQYFFEP